MVQDQESEGAGVAQSKPRPQPNREFVAPAEYSRPSAVSKLSGLQSSSSFAWRNGTKYPQTCMLNSWKATQTDCRLLSTLKELIRSIEDPASWGANTYAKQNLNISFKTFYNILIILVLTVIIDTK